MLCWGREPFLPTLVFSVARSFEAGSLYEMDACGLGWRRDPGADRRAFEKLSNCLAAEEQLRKGHADALGRSWDRRGTLAFERRRDYVRARQTSESNSTLATPRAFSRPAQECPLPME